MRYVIPIGTRIVAVILALALVAAGIVAIIEIVAAWLGHGWTVLPDNTADKLRSLHWSDQQVVVTLVIIGIVGLVALFFGLWRRPTLTLPAANTSDVNIERDALERSVQRELAAIDGINRARVRTTKKRLIARLDTNRRLGHEELHDAADTRVRGALDRQDLDLAVVIRLHARKP